MKLYLIKRTDNERPHYDESIGFVIRAESADAALEIAYKNAGDEGEDFWCHDNPRVHIEELTIEGPTKLILHDFNAG